MKKTDLDGAFELYYSQGYAVLTVRPPQAKGKPIYPEEVQNRMRILRIPRVPLSRIQEFIDNAANEPVRLVEWPSGADLNASFTVEINEDDSEAILVLMPPRKGGGLPSSEEIFSRLARDGIVYGVDEAAVEALLANPLFESPVCVARGTKPTHGKPLTPVFTFITDVGKPFLIDESGRVDLRELNFIQEKQAGDVLVRHEPAVDPVDGFTVRGIAISAERASRLYAVKPGKNTELSEDGATICATESGNAFVAGDTVHVEPIVVVDSVDYSTGNISYEGSVLVKREIADGFTVHAGGCLEVGECAGRVKLSAGRDMLLRGGMNGGDEGSVESKGDTYAKYIEGARVACGGSLFVTDAIMHSSVIVHGNLGLKGKHAGLIGGTTLVGGNVWCKSAGSVSETATLISAGVSPDVILEYSTLRRLIEKLQDRIDDLTRILRHADDPEVSAKARLERQNNERELLEAEGNLKTLRGRMIPSAKVRVVVEGRIFPRTTVSFGRDEYHAPANGTDRTVLTYVGGRILESGFNVDDAPDFESLVGGLDPRR